MSDSEYEEDDLLVFADFSNQLLPIQFSDENTAIKIIGLDDKHPIAEVNGNMFRGTYDYAMGTNVFFEKDLESPAADPLYDDVARQNYKVTAKTNKVINFKRIYVEKSINDSTRNTEEEIKPDENLKINITHEEAIKLFPSVNDPIWKKKDLL